MSDTDKIIAAHREEAKKTRSLLLWIFVGIPLIGLTGWGLVAGLTAVRDSQPSTYVPSTEMSVTTDVIAPQEIVTTSPTLAVITDSTMCSDVMKSASDSALKAYVGDFGNGTRDFFQGECGRNPTELAGTARKKVTSPDYLPGG